MDTELLRFVHHRRCRNAGVLLTGIVVAEHPVSGLLPHSVQVIADQQHQRRVVVKGRHSLHFRQSLGASHHIEALRLIVAGSGYDAPRLQDLLQLFVLHRPGIKEALRVAVFGKFHKSHIQIFLSCFLTLS